MIPDSNMRTISSGGVIGGAEFGISLADSAHIMTILRDTLYSDKIMAVLREYSANAWDSHRTSGKADVPIKIHLPTSDDPVLRIQDYGRGLSRDEVYNIYTQYGASTKRDQDLAVGMLGIGSKSGFAYSDTFNIVSIFEGVKSVYSAMLDASDKGVIQLIAEEPAEPGESGITIEIACKQSDFYEFKQKAEALFVHFDPRPIINTFLGASSEPIHKCEFGSIYRDDGYYGSVIAVMGCVPYKVNLGQVQNFMEGIPKGYDRIKCKLNFGIGEVHVNASREELKYSDKTKRAIIDKFNALVDDFVTKAVQRITAAGTSNWTRRLLSKELRSFGSVMPPESKFLTDYSVSVRDFIPQDVTGKDTIVQYSDKGPVNIEVEKKEYVFTLRIEKAHVFAIPIEDGMRFVIKDTTKSMKGYNLGSRDIIVNRGIHHPDLDHMIASFNKMLVDAKLDGVPVIKTSSMNWVSPSHNKSAPNSKYAMKFFEYKRTLHGSHKRSNDWEAVEREPSEDDVYVNISGFESSDGVLEDNYSRDKRLLEVFDMEMPPIYGYKFTVNNPAKARTGTEYSVWRKEIMQEIAETPAFEIIAQVQNWCHVFKEEADWHFAQNVKDSELYAVLGNDHIISQFVKKLLKNGQDKSSGEYQFAYDLVRTYAKLAKGLSPATEMYEEIKARYPLLGTENVQLRGILVKSDLPKWKQYFDIIDALPGATP